MLQHVKIFPKILLNCLLISLIPSAGLIYQMMTTEQEQKMVVEQSLKQSSDVLVSEVNNWVDKNLKNASLLVSFDEFKKMEAEKQVPKLVAATNNLDWVTLMFVADTKGDAVARSDGKDSKNYSDREYFKQVIAGNKIGQQVLIGKLEPVPLHCFAIPVNDDGKKLVGVLTQCSKLLSISEYITDTRIGKTGFALLVDDKSRLIAHGEDKSKLVGQLQDFKEHPGLGIDNLSVEVKEFEGKKRVFISRSVGPDWRLVVQQDYDEAFATYISARNSALILAVLTIIVTLALSFVVSYSISSPVVELTKVADSYSKGVFTKKILGQGRKDEIGELARAVGRMATTIQIAIGRLRKQKKNALKRGDRPRRGRPT